MESKELFGVQVEYYPDTVGKALMVRLNTSNLHSGGRMDLVEKLLTCGIFGLNAGINLGTTSFHPPLIRTG